MIKEVLLVGEAPRTGKTTIAKTLAKKHDAA